MKIISGKYKNRKLPVNILGNYRPTLMKVREAIFSIITSNKHEDLLLEDANILDLFCGTGSLGFEALSRGAGHVFFVDCEGESIDNIKKFANQLECSSSITAITKDVRFLTSFPNKINIVFIDPPYNKGLASIALRRLSKRDILDDNAYIFVESEINWKLAGDQSYNIIDEKIYNKSKITILKNVKTS